VNLDNLCERLIRKFGLGTRPDLRRGLFERLERIVAEQGERAYLVVASAAADAEGKTNPGHYFCRVVQLRLAERHLVATPEI
jgi:hypothetical protein